MGTLDRILKAKSTKDVLSHISDGIKEAEVTPEKVAAAKKITAELNNDDAIKKAALELVELRQKVAEYVKHERATKLACSMLESGQIAPDEILDKIAEFKESNMDIIEEAIKLGSYSTTGMKLADKDLSECGPFMLTLMAEQENNRY